MAHLGPNSDPFTSNFGPSWSPYGFKMGDIRPNPKSSKRLDDTSFGAMSSPLGQLGVKLSPQGAKLRHVGTDLDLPCSDGFNLESIWIASNFSPTWPIHANLGSSWVQDSWAQGPFGGSRGVSCAQPEPILRTQCDTLKTYVFTAISNFFCPQWAPTSAPDAPTQDQVAHAKPNLRPNGPKLRHVGPQLGSSRAQVGANWPEFGPKLGASRSCLARLKAKDGLSRLFFLSVLFSGCGRFSSRSDSNTLVSKIKLATPHMPWRMLGCYNETILATCTSPSERLRKLVTSSTWSPTMTQQSLSVLCLATSSALTDMVKRADGSWRKRTQTRLRCRRAWAKIKKEKNWCSMMGLGNSDSSSRISRFFRLFLDTTIAPNSSLAPTKCSAGTSSVFVSKRQSQSMRDFPTSLPRGTQNVTFWGIAKRSHSRWSCMLPCHIWAPPNASAAPEKAQHSPRTPADFSGVKIDLLGILWDIPHIFKSHQLKSNLGIHQLSKSSFTPTLVGPWLPNEQNVRLAFRHQHSHPRELLKTVAMLRGVWDMVI